MKPIPYRTAEGLLDLAALDPSAFAAPVLADTLAKVNRFNGRTPEPWSVASHSVLVAMLCSPARRAHGLLHDAHEAIIGDLTTPAVELICSANSRAARNIVVGAIALTKASLDRQIFAAWGLTRTVSDVDEVRHWDRIACQAEMVVFFGAGRSERDAEIDRAVGLIGDLPKGSSWRTAKGVWLGFAQGLAEAGQLRLAAEAPPPPAPHRVDGIAVDPLCDDCGERHEGACEDDDAEKGGPS